MVSAEERESLTMFGAERIGVYVGHILDETIYKTRPAIYCLFNPPCALGTATKFPARSWPACPGKWELPFFHPQKYSMRSLQTSSLEEHRVESAQKPYGRATLLTEALLATAIGIQQERPKGSN